MTKFHDADQPRQNESRKSRPQSLFTDNAFGLLSATIQQNLSGKGYSSPTPIQEQCIRPFLDGSDILGTAQTGTGKTAAFSLPILHLMSIGHKRADKGQPRALILAPTRELAAQIGECIETYGRNTPVSHTVIFGGVNQHRQVMSLQKGVDIVVATPGRLLDLMGQGYIRLDRINHFVLDEMDRMLDMGFIRDIRKIVDKLPRKRQTGFFSATMSPEIEKLAETLVRDPVRVDISPEQPAVDRIDQRMFHLGKSDRNNLLISLLEDPSLQKVVVFTLRKHAANRLAKQLDASGISATAIHGNKSQNARVRALKGFKDGEFRVLVATDVAARGLDVDGITHVVNFDLPNEPETYIHRIGRTARAGADGIAFSFCTSEEMGELKAIERCLGKAIPVESDHRFHREPSHQSRTEKAPPRSRNRSGQRRNRRRRPARK